MKPLISTRMSKTLLKDAKEIAKTAGFSSVQEFIRHSIREEVLRRRRQEALQELKALYGSGKKNYVPISKEELEKAVNERFR